MKLFFLLLTFFSLQSSLCLAGEGDFLTFLRKKNVDPDMKVIATLQQNRLLLSGQIRNGAYIYSFQGKQKQPMASEVYLQGKKIHPSQLQESKVESVFDDAYQTILDIHKHGFQLSVFLKSSQKNAKEGYLFYQICDSLICSLPRQVPFQIQ